MSYELKEKNSKIAVKIVAKNWVNLFEEAGYAISSIIIDYRKNEAARYLPIELSAKGIPELLILWINNILLKQQVSKLAFVEYDIKDISEEGDTYNLSAVVGGVKISDDVAVEISRYSANYETVSCRNEEGQLACLCDLNVRIDKKIEEEE